MSKLFSPTIKKLLITVVSQGIILGLSVITGFVLPSKMGPENFGYWQVYLFYLAYLNLFGLGFNDGIALFYGGFYYDDLPFARLRSSMRAVYLYQAIICVLGIGGVLTFKNARKAIEVASSIPIDRIVIETDCPYMSPEPFRGKRNDPGKLYRMAEKLAELRGLSVEEIHTITMENGKRLYRI